MNKYSKRALKTTATVGMSLAMVMSGMAAPVKAATSTLVCDVEKAYTQGEVFKKQTFKGAYTGAAGIKATIDAMKFEDLIAKEKVLVPSYLGFITASDPDTIVEITESNLAVLAEIKDGAKFGYFAKEDASVRNEDNVVVNIKKDEALQVTDITTASIAAAERTVATVKAEMEAYIKSVTNLKTITWDAAISAKSTETLTDSKGKEVAPSVSVVYNAKGTTTDVTTNPDTGIDEKEVTVKILMTDAVNDYSCDTVTEAKGIAIEGVNHANNVYNEIVKAFDAKKVSLDTVKTGDKVNFTGTNTAELGSDMVILTGTEATTTINMDFKATLKNLSKYISNTTDEGKAIDRFLGIEDAMLNMFKAEGYLVKAEAYGDKYEFKTTEAYATAVELLEKFTKFETYLTNLSTESYDRVTEARDNLQDLVDGYVAENDGELIDVYLTALDKYYENFIETKGEAGITKANVDAAIKEIKGGFSVTVGTKTYTGTKADYSTFKDNAGVEDYMTKFEDMYEEIEAVKDAVSKSNDAYKALIKGNTSVKDFVTGKDSDRLLGTKAFATIKSKITIEEYKILKTYKEEVLDTVLTMDTKEVGNSYVNKSTKSIFATKAQLDSVLANMGNIVDGKGKHDSLNNGVFTALDKETGDFNWDKFVAHMDKVSASYAALTTGIEKLDSITLVASDREAINAADDAVYFLQGAAGDNLTSAEARTVKNAERKVNELMDAYRLKFGSLSVEVNGWVNKGNGDWAYYEKGIAPTKWVAAGSNWFYVKDGVMLRNSWVANNSLGSKWYYVNDKGEMVSNTTVNGYTFDANGVWVENPTPKTVTEVKDEVIYENTLGEGDFIGEGDYVPEY